jgi:hypothetical protein
MRFLNLMGVPMGALLDAGAAFDPLAHSPLVGYDAQTISSLWQLSGGTSQVAANNDPVGRMSDLTGNGRHAIQATSGKRPLYKASHYNGKPYVVGDGVDDILSHFGAFFTDTCEIWLQAYISRTSFPGPGSYVYPILGQGTSQFPYVALDCYNGFGSTGQNRFYAEGCSNPEIDNTTYVYPAAVTGGRGHLLVATSSGSTAAITSTGIHLLSLDPAGGTIYYAPEGLGEAWVFPNPLVGDARLGMYGRMLGRW